MALLTLLYSNSGLFELKTSNKEALAISKADEYKLYIIKNPSIDSLIDMEILCGTQMFLQGAGSGVDLSTALISYHLDLL